MIKQLPCDDPRERVIKSDDFLVPNDLVMMLARGLESYKYVFWFCVQMISEMRLGLSI